MLAPFLLPGIVSVKLRWFLCGCILWGIGLVMTEEVVQCLKPWGGRQREAFRAAKAEFPKNREVDGAEGGPLRIPLRIVTWNILNGVMGADQIVEQLAGLQPDIVLMQESSPGRIRTAVMKSPYLRGFYQDPDAAILTRFPVARLPGGRLPPWTCSVFRVQVLPDRAITCVNVHLSHLELRTQVVRGWTWFGIQRAIARAAQELGELRATLELYAREGPLILAGDFNLPPYYADLRRATVGLKDCFADNGYGWGKTVPSKLPVMRVDMIFVPQDARVYDARAVGTRWSDHYMTLAEVALPVRRREADAKVARPSREAPAGRSGVPK
jgi:endonuclease/exonuclease/phosphatase family metal-dependent hydrolase